MAIGSVTNPIKVGVLFDMVYPPPPPPWDNRSDFLDSLRITFDEAFDSHQIDRPVELVIREVEGLPRGSVKAVIDAYKELVEEGCLAISGPLISENAVELVDYVNQHAHVPTIAWAGTDDWLGEWTFALSNGSLPDEPAVVANVMAHAGLHNPAVLVEPGVCGEQYMSYFREACQNEGLAIAGQVSVSATVGDLKANAELLKAPLQSLRDGGADSVVYLGFGYGTFVINEALALMKWAPPRYTTSAWEVGFVHEDALRSYYGWIGLEQYDEENQVTVAFLDRFEKRFGRRPEYFQPGYGHDVANVIAIALGKASPLSPKGVKNALERIRLLPAASGAPGTRISFGKYTRRGWMGAGFMVAREFDPENRSKTIFRGRIQAPKR